MELLAVDVVCVVFIFVLLMLVCVVFIFVLLMLVWVGVVLRPRGRAWVVLVSRSLPCIKIGRHRSHLGAGRTPHIDSSLFAQTSSMAIRLVVIKLNVHGRSLGIPWSIFTFSVLQYNAICEILMIIICTIAVFFHSRELKIIFLH